MKTSPIHTAALLLALSLAPLSPSLRAEPGHKFAPVTAGEKAAIDAALPKAAADKPVKARKLLVFYRTEGFVHDSIAVAREALRRLGESSGAYSVVESEDMAVFTPESLAGFDAVAFVSTTQLAFKEPAQRKALLDFVASGKGVVGIHAATDNFPTWPEGQALIGGCFHGHPWTAGDTVAVKLDEPEHPLDASFGKQGFLVKDEIYRMKAPYTRDRLRVLLSLDMSRKINERPKAGITGADGDYGISWIRTEGAGRVFYSSLGHNKDIYFTPQILGHFLDGIRYALGDLKADAVPTAKLAVKPTPALAPESGATLQELARRSRSALTIDAAILKVKNLAVGGTGEVPAIERSIIKLTGEERLRAETKLVEILADSGVESKRAALLLLGRIGSAASVPAIAKTARTEGLAADAVDALANLRATEAGAALAELATDKNFPARVAAINALGRPGSPAALAALTRLAKENPDTAVFEALARTNSPEALAVIRSAPVGEARDRAALALAARLATHSASVTLARETLAGDAAPEHRVEAARILLRSTSPVKSETALIKELAGNPAVARLFVRSGRPDALAAVVESWDAGDNARRSAALAAAGDSGAIVTLPLIDKGLTSTDAVVRADAVLALGRCAHGEATARLVPLLAQTPDVSAAVKNALARLPSGKADEAMRAALADASTSGPARATLLDALVARLDKETFPIALRLTKESAAPVRTAAFAALGALAGPRDLPAVLGAASAIVKSADRRAWTKAVFTAAESAPDRAAAVSLLASTASAPDFAEKSTLLEALAAMPGDEAKNTLGAMLAAKEIETRKEVVRALASSRNATARTLLAEAALKASDESERTLAIRGFLDTLAALNPKAAERIAEYRRVWPVAGTEEKDAMLSAAKNIKDAAAKSFVEEFSPPPAPSAPTSSHAKSAPVAVTAGA